jgi:ABC-type nitrate/sulfonate/bicarbonate transport system substrate-binding protein
MMKARRWMLLAVACGVVLAAAVAQAEPAKIDRPAPDIAAGPWINSTPLTMAALRGRVVLVEFWTYG